jgi:hypothetical protein
MSDRPTMIWVGDPAILPANCVVLLMATDPEDPNVEARRACWVRYWPTGRDYPMYRSCDQSDLEPLDSALTQTPQ